MDTIVLNQTNIVTGSNNSSLTYNFPNSILFDNHEIAVQSISMYYSWQNINSSPLANNTFTYSWIVGVTSTTYTVTIPDGLYEIAQINAYLQFRMIQNGTYLINSAGQNVYYAEMLVEPTRYAINIITYPVPTSLPASWTAPVANVQTGSLAFVGYPTTTFNPVVTIPSSFNLIVGYVAGFATVVNTGVNTILSYFSTISPQISPVSSLLVTCSNIDNRYAIPNNVIYSVVPDVTFGSLLAIKTNEYVWAKLLHGTQSQITIKFIGNDFSSISILDPNIVIILVIRRKENTNK
jgi:hypothetical protein